METTFKVYRFDPENGRKPDFAMYTVDLPDSATVIDGLRHIRDELDPSLAFRASCDRGSCGDCALRINKKGKLGCTLKIAKTVKDGVVKVEPIRNIPVLKDLVYDMETFLWQKVKSVQPWITPREPEPDGEYVVAEEKLSEVRKAMSCVMCGLCDEGCVVIKIDKAFVGPAALTKAYRAVFDPRDGEHQHNERLRQVSGSGGVWDCTHCFEANGHCPLGLEPTTRLFEVRDEAIRRGIRSGTDNPKVQRHYDSFLNSVKRSGWLDEGRLAIESEGLSNIAGLAKLLPTVVRALPKGKAPLPYLHPKRPGTQAIRRIIEKAERSKA